MKSKKHVTSLDDRQKSYLRSLHFAQIGLEVGFVTFVLSVLTVNISASSPIYGVFVFFTILLSSLVILVFGVIVSVTIFSFRKLASPLATLAQTPRNWVIITWISVILTAFLLIFSFLVEAGNFNPTRLIPIALSLLMLLISCACTIITTHLLWRRFNKKAGVTPRLFVYSLLGIGLLLTALFGSYSTTESIAFHKVSSSDAGLELGQSEIRQPGRNGEKRTTRSLLFGYEISSNQTNPIDEVTAVGTRKYQYMHCSDGSYRYYTSEQFKNPNTGFTHQSPDSCAQNGAGTQIALSDTPPAEKVIQQVPVYRAPSYHSTTCTPSYFGNSVTCSGYY